jgi:hypothetical protein
MSSDQVNSRLARGSGNRVESHPQQSAHAIASLNGQALTRNSGVPLDLNWVQEIHVNTSAVAGFPPHGKTGMAGSMAVASHHLYGSDDALGR